MTTHHAVVWIDHNEARALALDPEGTGYRELAHLRAHDTHTHPKKYDGHRHPADPRFLVAAEDLIAHCDAVALVGPSAAKDELVSHLERIGSPHRARIVAVSSLDRVGDGELAATAREIFRGVDRMHGIHVAGPRGAS
jgi:hypothetical protein